MRESMVDDENTYRSTMSHYIPADEQRFLSGNYTHRQHKPGGTYAMLAQAFSHFPV